MSQQLLVTLGCMVGAGVFVVWLAWLTTRFEYRITEKSLQVRLFGVSVRNVELTDIESVSRHRVGWGENWWNTMQPFRRVLVIRRKSGLIKNFVITPWHRYAFKAELERAIRRCNPAGQAGGLEEAKEGGQEAEEAA